jgi:hypothetical protein
MRSYAQTKKGTPGMLIQEFQKLTGCEDPRAYETANAVYMQCELDKFKFCKLWKKYSKIDHPLFPHIPKEIRNPSITARLAAWRAEKADQWKRFNTFKRRVARVIRWSEVNNKPCLCTTVRTLMAKGVTVNKSDLWAWSDLFPEDISINLIYDLDNIFIFKSCLTGWRKERQNEPHNQAF